MALSLLLSSITLYAGGALLNDAQAQPTNKATILSINDVYRIEGINDGKDGGMPRVRALRAELERSTPDLLFLHGGDFLSPSFLGRTYKGAQMIDLMNVMDGSPATGTHDPRMFVTFGNHEFDDSHCGKNGPLAERVKESEFLWLTSNLDFSGCDKLKALAGSPKISGHRVVESGGLKIGIYGVTLPRHKYAAIASDPVKASCSEIKALRAKGVDAIVALTHLPWRKDLELLGLAPGGKALPSASRVCKETPDVVIGGHDHRQLALPSKNPRLFKADADALTAWVVELEKNKGGTLQVKGRLVQLDESRKPDPLANRLAQQWQLRHDERFCLRDCLKQPKTSHKQCMKTVTGGACLTNKITHTTAAIETEEIYNRSFETGFGDWITDAMRVAGNVDVAFFNAGALRLNYTLKAGSEITRRHLEQMFPFRNKFVVREITGKTLWNAVAHAVKKRGEGGWMHFSGMAVQLKGTGEGQALQKILIKKTDGSVLEITPDSSQVIKIASLSFVLANGDGHGFKLCPEIKNIWACKSKLEAENNWPLKGAGSDLAGFVRLKLSEVDPAQGLKLSVDRRLCDPGQKDCLIERWSRRK
jgi:2',3'-cyclic-nucleotide 2'-phosphodiesterase (5'-nucleotidase family)